MNAIGRKIWNDNTRHRKFLGIPFALKRPSTNELKDLIEEAVNEKSCFIVKFKNEIFPNNELTLEQTIPQIKAKIDNTDSNTIVYFEGTIAPSSYQDRFIFSHWEYYDCDDGLDDMYTAKKANPTEECKRAIYRKERVEIVPCYQLKL